jgi:K+-sensing histidine kinase KdpD
MKQTRFSLTLRYLRNSLLAVLTVSAATIPMFLIGRNVLGEAVIALVYLVPVTWSANRWGQLAGISAALTASLAFNFLFIPPFFTFAIARLEGWLLLAIFLGVAIIVVERIQASLSQAREAVFMYEMSSAICSQRTSEGVAYSVACQIQQLFQACQVNVIFHPNKNDPAIAASEPSDCSGMGKPDRIIPIVNSWGLVGEIQIWRGVYMELPQVESRLFQNFALQTARAFERTHPMEPEKHIKGTLSKAPAK